MTDHDETVRARHVQSLLAQQYEVECLLAEALGYTYDADHGWAIGDHTIVTLAAEVHRRGITTRPTRLLLTREAVLLLTREGVALAHHRYYCHEDWRTTCTAVDQHDYDYADTLTEILAMSKEDGK